MSAYVYGRCPPTGGVRLAGVRLAGVRLAGVRLAGVLMYMAGVLMYMAGVRLREVSVSGGSTVVSAIFISSRYSKI